MTHTIKVAGATVPYPEPTTTSITAVMRGNRRVDTRLEIRVRRLIHSQGLRYRKDLLIEADDVKVRPDIVFTRLRLAVFLDGCFWHSCPEHGNTPRANQPYWNAKLVKNRARDARVNSALERDGWTVLRLWEHLPPEEAATMITAQVDRLREALSKGA